MKDTPYERLKNLAAMRLMNQMPLEAARKEWADTYGAIDMEEMQERRLLAIAYFKKMFAGEPRHGSLFKGV